MIPILYEKDEIAFVSNGLGRLRDCISATVVEERNGVYELDFQYPVTGAHYDEIKCGCIVGVTHDDSGDVQPFDIVSYTKPIDGVVTFHCVHVSYRQSYMTATSPAAVNSLADAFSMISVNAEPENPFTYETDKTSTGYLGVSSGIPYTVRQMLGGVEGSILDAYGGEYEWDKWKVILHSARGTNTNFKIRYGVNMVDFSDETNYEGTYSSCIPYWTDGNNLVVGDKVNDTNSTYTGRGECVPLDLSEKFETKPSKSSLEAKAASYMDGNNTFLPAQTINVEFVRLQESAEYKAYSSLMQCKLCDTIEVIFPEYESSGTFKIVKTEWNVLTDRYESMELGTLSTSLAEALGLTENAGRLTDYAERSGLFKVTEVPVTISGGINANTNVAASSRSMTSQTGFNAVGIVGWASNYWRVRPTTNYIVDNSHIYCGFGNDTATNVTSDVTVTFRVLWMNATSA